MNPQHPKAIEAQQRAEENNQLRQEYRQSVKEATASMGVHFLTIGATTICYKVDQHDVIEFSTAICNRKVDKPISEIGKYIALQRFTEGATVLIRKARSLTPREWFEWSFSI